MITDYHKTNNLAVADAEVVRQDQLARRKSGFIELTVVRSSDNNVAVVIDNFTYLDALAIEAPIRETYLVGPHDTAESTLWRTEIGWPIFQTVVELKWIKGEG
jgi:hypothetical protein